MNAKRLSKGPRNPRGEIIEMQRILLTDIRNPKTMPHIRAQCARAYDVLEERLRILNNKPLPGMLRPDIAQEREAKRAGKRKGPSLLPMPEVPSASVPSSPSTPKECESSSISVKYGDPKFDRTAGNG